jgi:hypothetical protein
VAPNNITDVESQPQNRQSRRFVLTAGDAIEGLVAPGSAKPAGIMIKGPFDNNPLTIKMREQSGVACEVKVQATYDLAYLELEIDASDNSGPFPDLTYTAASPTWEDIFTQSLVGLGKASQVIDWATASLSEDRAPTALRFFFSSVAKGLVRFELEEGIL